MGLENLGSPSRRASSHINTTSIVRVLHHARQVLAMRWPSFWSSSKNGEQGAEPAKWSNEVSDSVLGTEKPADFPTAPPPSSRLFDLRLQSYLTPQTIVSTIVLTSGCLGFYRFYRKFLRRIPAVGNISPGFFRKRSVFGKVTSVGDGDNFRIYHTPGGYLAGWGWLRSIPADKKALKNNTVGYYRLYRLSND